MHDAAGGQSRSSFASHVFPLFVTSQRSGGTEVGGTPVATGAPDGVAVATGGVVGSVVGAAVGADVGTAVVVGAVVAVGSVSGFFGGWGSPVLQAAAAATVTTNGAAKMRRFTRTGMVDRTLSGGTASSGGSFSAPRDARRRASGFSAGSLGQWAFGLALLKASAAL